MPNPGSTAFYTKDHLANYIHKYGFKIGASTYGKPTIRWWGENAVLKIGNYCSIADGVVIFLGGNHRTDWVTTYPFPALLQRWPEAGRSVGHPATKGDVVIGSDVWLGSQSMIMSGVEIGDGAVVAARAVVTRNVASYAVVGGNPAKVISKRFSDDQIQRLLQLRWWDWEEPKIRDFLPRLLSGDIDQFLYPAEGKGV